MRLLWVIFLILSQLSSFSSNFFSGSFSGGFIQNNGQFDKNVRYQYFSGSSRIYFHTDKIIYQYFAARKDSITIQNIELKLLNSNPFSFRHAKPKSCKINYQTDGNNLENKSVFSELLVEEAYEKIDMLYFSQEKGIKYDLIVKPGGNLKSVLLQYSGAEDIILRDKKLILKTRIGEIVESIPCAYQEINGKKKFYKN